MRQIDVRKYTNGTTTIVTDDKRLLLKVVKHFRAQEIKKINDFAEEKIADIDNMISSLEDEISAERA